MAAAALLCVLFAAGRGGIDRVASAGVPVPAGGSIPLLRIGVAPEVDRLEVGASGAWHIGIVGRGYRPTRLNAGEAWTFAAHGDLLVIHDAAGRTRGEVADTVFIFPEDEERGSLLVNGRAYRGELLVWANHGDVTAANAVDLESYLLAVLPVEMGPQPPPRMEALKAQAVAARSYTLSMMGRWAERGFDLLATVEDQVYGGVPAEKPECTQAVEETRGLVAVDEGQPIRAFYCSTCGGHTAAPQEVWNRPPAPYLCGVRDLASDAGASFCSASPFFHWKEEWGGRDFETMLGRSLERVRPGWNARRAGRLTGVEIRARSESRRVSCLRLHFAHEHVDLSGDEIRWAIRRPNGEGLRSALLTEVVVTRRKGGIAKIRITGQGYGHGVGMCQFGAMGMAEAGYSYAQILAFYYRGSKILRFY